VVSLVLMLIFVVFLGFELGMVWVVGVVLWCGEGEGFEVLFVYWFKYDDWLWLKGKFDFDELWVGVVVCEVLEEIGLYCELGVLLL